MKKFLTIFTLICGTLAMNSCLDEDPLFDPSGSNNVVEFYDIGAIASPAGAVHPLYISTFKPGGKLNLIVSYSGAGSNDKDITVDIEVSQEALDAYNEEQGTAYEVLPADLYDVDSWTVTIPKGEKQVVIEVVPDIENFDFAKAYALPLTIASASSGVISRNFGTAIYSIGAQNKYDGLYDVTGTMVDGFNGAFTGYYPKVIELRTINANTVEYYDHDFALRGHVFYTGTGLSYYGTFVARITFDENDNVVTVVNGYGQPAGGLSRSGRLDGTGVNKMTFAGDGNPDEMQISYVMVQGGVDRSFFNETYTYVGPR